ncbi:hypothetical protein BCR43DRAFT_491643 [Syncephalastrum racemosum]|uniref:SAM domain-containing protein n=1 Tax=Syncephalastrum racemosum TaxID=13706 RepID=A0A1X2HC82_SYNRA|nr:hypothetical protein BCR43DRAFT_491643 [Syncephalastrum racemosum]
MTTHDVHRAMEENLFNTFHRHNPLQPPPPPMGTGGPSPVFRSMTASDLIGLLPTTPTSATPPPPPPHTSSRSNRPNSDILATQGLSGSSAEAEAIDRWFENIQRYEQMLEEVAAASLDQEFKDELHHVNQWFRCRSDAERTAALYTVVQNASQIQIRFLITVLQQLANQDPMGELLSSSAAAQEKAPVTVAGSVVSTESEYEMRKRQMYPPSRRATRSNLCNRLTSALSEPDDLRRRNRDLLSAHRMGGLHQQGLLYEKALAARAQIQAANSANSTSTSSSSSSSSHRSSNPQPPSAFPSAAPFPRMKTSLSSSTDSSVAAAAAAAAAAAMRPPSLFGNDWPFPLARKSEKASLVGRIGDRGSVKSADDNWSFGSLSSARRWAVARNNKNDTIREDPEQERNGNDRLANSLSALEQAQARLRRDQHQQHQQQHHHQHQHPSQHPQHPHPHHSTQKQHPPSTTQTAPPTTPSKELRWAPDVQDQPSPPAPPQPQPQQQQQQQFGQFLAPPPSGPEGYLSDESDASHKDDEPQLTGAARRRKRSSAARALKDKIAAETVDFELMKDVQNWLRSLRLHKYGHAFTGMQWQQVVRMSDEDMLQAGVSTIGARRKLLKVFENVMQHCDENGIEY